MIPFPISANHHQIKTLQSGGSVSFSPDMLGRGSNFLLTPSQHAKARHAASNGRPFRMHMDANQFRHNAIHGTGIWSNFKDAVKKGVSKVKDLVKNPALRKLAGSKAAQILPGLLSKGGNKLLDAIGSRTTNPLVHAGIMKGRQAIHNNAGKIGVLAGNKIAGQDLGMPGQGHRINGSGVKGVLGSANQWRPVPLSQQGAGARRRKRSHRGRGLTLMASR